MSKPIGGTYTLYYHGVPSVPIAHDAPPLEISSIVNELIERVSAYEREAEEVAIETGYHGWVEQAGHQRPYIDVWRAAVSWQKSRHPEEDWVEE